MDDLMDCMPDEFGYFKGKKKQVPSFNLTRLSQCVQVLQSPRLLRVGMFCSKCQHKECPGCRAAVRHGAELELLKCRQLP